MKLYRCNVCGYVREADENQTEDCIKCGKPASHFELISDEDTKKIYESDRTNDILGELINLSMRINKLAREGAEINLDPTCLGVFNKTQDLTWEIKQLAKAEIAGHLKKGKW